MDKQQKIIIFSGIGVVLILIAVLVWLLFFRDSSSVPEKPETEVPMAAPVSDEYLQMQNDSLRLVADHGRY